jgi:hypothetical protein
MNGIALEHVDLKSTLHMARIRWMGFDEGLKYAQKRLRSGDLFDSDLLVQAIPMVKYAFLSLLQAWSWGCEKIEFVMKAGPGRSWRIRYHLPDGSLKHEETRCEPDTIVDVARVFFNLGESVDTDPAKAKKTGKVSRRIVGKCRGEKVVLDIVWHTVSDADERRWLAALDQALKQPTFTTRDETVEERLDVVIRRSSLGS